MTSQTVVRISLPHGQWWEIETRPRWSHVRQWTLGHVTSGAGPTKVRYGEQDLIERALVSLTTGWSFDEPVSLHSLARREAGDVVAAMKLLEDSVGALWNSRRVKALAEKLFGGLAIGRVPREFAEVHIMALTGWNWQTLQATPADIVDKMTTYMAVGAPWTPVALSVFQTILSIRMLTGP